MKVDSLVPLGSFAPMLALDWRPQDFSICCYDAVVEALVELRDDVAPVAQEQTKVRPKSRKSLDCRVRKALGPVCYLLAMRSVGKSFYFSEVCCYRKIVPLPLPN